MSGERKSEHHNHKEIAQAPCFLKFVPQIQTNSQTHHQNRLITKPTEPNLPISFSVLLKPSKHTPKQMEDDGIEAVLSKAIDLRLKISNCIHKASSNSFTTNKQEREGHEESVSVVNVLEKKKSESFDGEESFGDGEEAERLLHIRDALESLEHQLSSLQDMQQQQRYEREVALSEIEHSRKVLLDKLKEYSGEYLEVIQEASAFAGETVESNTDLLLPPYPSRPPQSLAVDGHYPSQFPLVRKFLRNGLTTGEAKKNRNGTDQEEAASNRSNKGLGHVIGAAARTVITAVGVITVLSLSGVGPTIGLRGIPLSVLGLFQQPRRRERGHMAECPPGRVLVKENGEARCVVKERVAIPFESVAAKPDLNYGCG